MDIKDLFLSCRRGDLSKVQYLVEQKEVELNVRDKWDSTPLYYACLCGHGQVVKYLLDNGSKCEPNTFDGERCLYGALNNNIRGLLKNYKQVSAQTIVRDNYAEFLRKLFERGYYADVAFNVRGETFSAHRCILASRSEYFKEQFENKWRKRAVIHINHQLVEPWAFKALLGWIYTDRLEIQIDDLPEISRLARQCHFTQLLEALEERHQRVVSFGSTKPGVHVTMLSLEPTQNFSGLKKDFGKLADLALPAGFWDEEISPMFPFLPQDVQLYPDVIYQVNNYQFHCHQAFFCSRSDYFKALDEDHFGEKMYSTESGLPIITIGNVNAEVFVQVLCYVYQDCCEVNANNIYDLVSAGDMFLLPSLKRYCGNIMSREVDVDNVINMLRLARLYNLPKLEDACAGVMADNIDMLIQLSEFAELVKEDASSVQGRQETDSIPIIDDIRFHLTNFVQTYSDMYEADHRMGLVDSFLETLDLDA